MVARDLVQGEPGGYQVERLLADFERFLVREDRSPETVRSYGWALKRLLDFLGARSLTKLDTPLLRGTLEAWQDTLQPMKPRSRALATTAVRQFLRWAADHDYCDPRAERWLAKIKVRKGKPKPIAPGPLETLKAYFGQRPQPYQLVAGRRVAAKFYLQRLRDRALFFYLLATGLRVSELLQVPREGFEHCIVVQKGGTEKEVVLAPELAAIVREYLAQRRDNLPACFVGHPRQGAAGPLTAAQIRGIWRVATRRLGIPGFTTHQTRHTFATTLLEQGVDPFTVAAMLGHHGMGTIMTYAELRPKQRQGAIEAVMRTLGTPASLPMPEARARPKKRKARLRVVPDRADSHGNLF